MKTKHCYASEQDISYWYILLILKSNENENEKPNQSTMLTAEECCSYILCYKKVV